MVWCMQSVADHTSGVLRLVAVPTELSDCANRLHARQAVAPLDHHQGSSSFDKFMGEPYSKFMLRFTKRVAKRLCHHSQRAFNRTPAGVRLS